MKTLRRISQAVFFVLFFGLFLWTAYPLRKFIAVDLFFRLDPLIAVTAGIAARKIITKLIFAFLLLALTVIFGRFFCGWICPLGFIIDLVNKIFPVKKSGKKYISLKSIKYVLLFIVLVAALFSVQIAGFFDPFSILLKSTTIIIYPVFVYAVEGIFNALVHIPFLENPVYAVWDSLTGTVLPAAQRYFTGSLLISIIFIVILSMALFQRRFWCRNICPLGALYGLFSRFSLYKRKVSDKCISCGICSTRCRMGAISNDYISTDTAECILCMDCTDNCPTNAVTFGFSVSDKNSKPEVDLNRRRILFAGVAGIAAASVVSRAVSKPSVKGTVVRPPGSVEESSFLDLCIRCGECVRICSTSGGGLQHSLLESGLQGLWSPVLVPEMGYCEYNCNLCGKVCPTGAISALSLEQRQKVKMGTAHFDKTRCIPWYYGEDCMVCEEHCPLPDKAIKFRTSEVTTINGDKAVVNLPYVVEENCIGCGICVNRCPVDGKKGIFLTNAEEQRF